MSFVHEQYAKHALSLVQLLKWLATWEKKPNAFQIKDGQIWLGLQTSQRFAIGVARRRIFGKYPFLAVQGAEQEWVKSIPWVRAEVRMGSRRLFLISARCFGDQDEIPDIPPQVLAIEFDIVDKLAGLSQAKFLEARGIWLDEGGAPQVENGPTWWKIPLVLKADDQPVLSEDEKKLGYTEEDYIRQQLAQAGKWVGAGEENIGKESVIATPDYAGEASEVPSDLRDILLTPTDFKSLDRKVR